MTTKLGKEWGKKKETCIQYAKAAKQMIIREDQKANEKEIKQVIILLACCR